MLEVIRNSFILVKTNLVERGIENSTFWVERKIYPMEDIFYEEM